jgi:hypothetical protein
VILGLHSDMETERGRADRPVEMANQSVITVGIGVYLLKDFSMTHYRNLCHLSLRPSEFSTPLGNLARKEYHATCGLQRGYLAARIGEHFGKIDSTTSLAVLTGYSILLPQSHREAQYSEAPGSAES